jgi:VanZ family protein
MQERPLAVVPVWRWWVGFLAVLAFALVMTVRAYREGLPKIFELPYFDKVAHFFTAGLLAFFLDGGLRRRNLSLARGITVPLAAAFILVPAGIEEFLQRYATFRTASYGDFAADVVGVLLLLPLSRRLAR